MPLTPQLLPTERQLLQDSRANFCYTFCMRLRTLSRLHDFENKTVLVRIDADVDLEGQHVLDDTRLLASLETIRYILKHGGSVILLGHLGRPGGKSLPEYSLLPIAKWYQERFDGHIQEELFGDFPGWKITDKLSLLENLRFYKGEEENDPSFAEKLANLGNVYVNEAFAVSHRNHASITGIATLLPSYAGFHLATEVEALSRILENPQRPLIVLIGGAKIETKLPVVEKMHHIADYVLVGGKIAEETKELLRVQHEKITGKKSVILVADNTPDGLDISQKDTENFIQILSLAKTIVWNGPMGKMGSAKTEKNTLTIATAIARSSAYTVVGGGDSLTFLREHKLIHKYSFVSTGGGAMLDFLSGKTLPGIQALEQ